MKKIFLILLIAGIVCVGYGWGGPGNTSSGSSYVQPDRLTTEQAKTLVLKAINNIEKSKGYRIRTDVTIGIDNEPENGGTAEVLYRDDTHFQFILTFRERDEERSAELYRDGDKIIVLLTGGNEDEILVKEDATEVFSETNEIADVFYRRLLTLTKENLAIANCTGLDCPYTRDKQTGYIIEISFDKEGKAKLMAPYFKEMFDDDENIECTYYLEVIIGNDDSLINKITYGIRFTAKDEEYTRAIALRATSYLSDYNQVELQPSDKIKNILANYKDAESTFSIHGCGVSSSEASALAGLKMLTAQEAVWRQQDADGNGIKDYWTYDISCFNRIYRSDSITKVGFIDIAFARADDYPATDTAFAGSPAIEPWIGDTIDDSDAATLTSKSGYLFRAMLTDENGVPYNQNPVGSSGINACNYTKFAFVAYPEVYGTSGVNTFIVNESGTVYCTDCGSDENKIVLKWPINNADAPATSAIGPGGRVWAPAE